MLATAHWVYLDLEKTGCTFLRNSLQALYPSHFFLNVQKHSLLQCKAALPTLMTIRDPYAYYFSLWRYGLDRRGGFFEQVSRFFPALAKMMYGTHTIEAFSAFLDFVLHTPVRYPNPFRLDWLPLGLDLYTVRILSMIIPVDERQNFLNALGNDCVSDSTLLDAMSHYVPDILIRTDTLNNDFHQLAHQGKLDFMHLPPNWTDLFPLDLSPENSSLSLSANSLETYLLPGWKDAIAKHSALAFSLIEQASSQLTR
jgi:hypothetical protein